MPRPRTLLLLVALFVWFASGIESFKLGGWAALERDPGQALWPPWRPLQLYVSYGGDERLYFQYAQLLIGQPADLAYVARKQQGDAAANLAALKARVRSGPGWRLPYRDFPVEYPPLAVAAMALPRLVAGTLAGYRIAFAGMIGVLYLVLGWIAARLAQTIARSSCSCASTNTSTSTNTACDHVSVPESVWRRMLLLGLAVGPLLVQRFDLLPATLVAGALLALGRRRDGLAGILLGLGAMAKLYPALLLAPVCAFLIAAGGLRRAAMLAGAAATTALAVAAPFLALAPAPFLRSVLLYGARPFQLESLPGTLALALGGRSAVSGGFGSYNVALPSAAEAIGGLLFWIALGALAVAAARSGARLRAALPADQLRALCGWVLATVAAILCTSRVLSPQFVIWLLPWPAVLLGGRRILSGTLACLALTQAFYPFLYSALRAGHPPVVALLIARNAGLVALAVAAVCAARSIGRSPATARATPPLEPPLSPNIRGASAVQDP